VHSSVYCLPADLLGEGADRVVGTVRDRAGVSGVTVAACCHGFDPKRELVRAELAVDPRALSQAGVHLEEPLYLAEPADTAAALTWYRAQLGPDAPLSVVLRPGPPDTTTPASLAEKAQLARSHNCTELNFYAYGLYRLQSLTQIRQALPTP
jgi:hypothetical protein